MKLNYIHNSEFYYMFKTVDVLYVTQKKNHVYNPDKNNHKLQQLSKYHILPSFCYIINYSSFVTH